MQVTVNGIAAKAEWDGFAKSRADDGPRVTIRYQVPYQYSDTFADSLIGGLVWTGGVRGTIRYVPRHICPTNPSLYCLRANVEYFAERPDLAQGVTLNGAQPLGPGTSGLIGFDTAVVVAEYGNLIWPQQASDDPGGAQSFMNDDAPGEPIIFAECEIDFASEVITADAQQYKFFTEPTTPPGMDRMAVAIRNPISTWRITRHNWPYLPFATVMNMVGRYNLTTFLGQPPGYVLFDNCRTKQQMTGDGTKCQAWEMVFLVKTRTWNSFLRPNDLTWDTLVDGNGNAPYQGVELKPLVQ